MRKMTNAKKTGVLSRRSVCGSGLSAAALLLSGCGGGGGDSSGGGSSGPVNGGLTGNMYYSFTSTVGIVDLATGNFNEITQKAGSTPDQLSFVYDASYFDLSADGKTLFFMENLSPPRVAAVDIASNTVKTVFKVGNAKNWGEIRLSPDGQKVAMVRVGDNGGNGVQIFDTSGTFITYYKKEGAVNSVAWTSDNRLLYSDDGIYLTDPGDLKNSSRINITSASSVSVNPAGDKIVYASKGHIWTMGINGNDALQVTAGDIAEFQPRWSPDGKHIVFQSQIESANTAGGGTVVSTGNVYYLAVIPADGRQYTLKKTGPSGTSAGVATGVSAGDGVILLKAKDRKISDRLLFDIPAYDMIWR
jgi:Tol biopolymer transport system component